MTERISTRCHAVTRTGSVCLRAHAVVRFDRGGGRRFNGAPVCDRHNRLFSRRPGGARYDSGDGKRDVRWCVRGGWMR